MEGKTKGILQKTTQNTPHARALDYRLSSFSFSLSLWIVVVVVGFLDMAFLKRNLAITFVNNVFKLIAV
jgi:hypothetical protein